MGFMLFILYYLSENRKSENYIKQQFNNSFFVSNYYYPYNSLNPYFYLYFKSKLFISTETNFFWGKWKSDLKINLIFNLFMQESKFHIIEFKTINKKNDL